jgi:hypothetical protein
MRGYSSSWFAIVKENIGKTSGLVQLTASILTPAFFRVAIFEAVNTIKELWQ